MTALGVAIADDFPLSEVLWRAVAPTVTRNVTVYQIHNFIEHLIPAVLVDAMLRISGKKPM